MTPLDFWTAVHDDDDLEYLGVRGGEVLVRSVAHGGTVALTPSAILDCDWTILREVMTFRRTPQVLLHVARIVGYYSMMRNWNRSKVVEQQDRRRGRYALCAGELARQELPAEVLAIMADGGAEMECRL